MYSIGIKTPTRNEGHLQLLDIFIKNIIFILTLIYVNWENQLSLNVRYVDCENLKFKYNSKFE